MEGKIVVRRPDTGWLTPVDVEIVKRMIDGMSTKQIAAEIGASSRLVDVRRHRMIRRLKCGNAYQLIAVLFREKILT
jgi:DNA-binding CsgD family transcriptional regulator